MGDVGHKECQEEYEEEQEGFKHKRLSIQQFYQFILTLMAGEFSAAGHPYGEEVIHMAARFVDAPDINPAFFVGPAAAGVQVSGSAGQLLIKR